MRSFFSLPKLIIALGILFFLFIAGLSLVSFEVFKSFLDSMAGDGDADRVTRDMHQSIVFGTRVIALVGVSALGSLYHYVDNINFNFNPARILSQTSQKFYTWVQNEEKIHLLILVSSCLAGIWMRIYHLFQPMRSDESWTFLYFVSQPFVLSISLYTSPNNHLLHTALAHISTSVFGDAPWALRLPALVAGILLIPAVYLLARKFSGKTAGLLAAVLVSIWPILIDYSSNARGYSLIMLFTVILILAALEWHHNNCTATKIVFSITAALGLYTTPLFLFPLGGTGIWLLILTFQNELIPNKWIFIKDMCWTAFAAMAITIVLYAPVFMTSGLAAIIANDTVLQSAIDPRGSLVGSLQHVWSHFTSQFHFGFKLFLAVGFLASFIRNPRYSVTLWLSIAIWSAMIIFIPETAAPFRVWLFALPLVLGFVAIGWSTILKHDRLISVTSALILICSTFVLISKEPGTYYKSFGALPEAEDIVLYLGNELNGTDGLVTSFPANRTLTYYSRIHQIESTIRLARTRGMNQEIDRLFVVVNFPRTDYLDVLEHHDRNRGSGFLTRQHEVVHMEPIGETSVVILRVMEPKLSVVKTTEIPNISSMEMR